MLNEYFTLNGVIIYCDSYMEDNRIIVSNDSSYIITTNKIAKLIKESFLKKERKSKLININDLNDNKSPKTNNSTSSKTNNNTSIKTL